MRSASRTSLVVASLLIAALAAPAAAINLGAVDLAATAYLNNSLSDCTQCYGNVRKAHCHRVAIGIYLTDLARKNSGTPGVPTVVQSRSIIRGSQRSVITPNTNDFSFNSIFCLGFNRLVPFRALLDDVVNPPPRELYYVRGAAFFLQRNIAGSTVDSDVLRVAANGRLTSLGGRFKFSNPAGIAAPAVRTAINNALRGNPWTNSQLTTNTALVQLDQVSPTIVEGIIPFKNNPTF